jgi:integrase/recombinase XerD
MAQAKTLTDKELKRLLDLMPARKHPARDRLMLLMTTWAGMRVGEVAALTVGDVRDAEGNVREEVRLSKNQTKGHHERTVFLPKKLRDEITKYLISRSPIADHKPLFYTQRRAGFTANTLTQHFHYLYRWAGITGASSHSGRRTFITGLAAKGVSVRVLASLAGHKSIATTQAYIDVNDDMKRRAVELV